MPELPASAFYTGLVADLYGPLKSTSFHADPYHDLIRRFGEPALELGCGDGDPLLDLRGRGLDVDGIDSSPDMIERLHRRASERGMAVNAWVDLMETLRAPRSYQTVFLAGPTFNLLPDDHAMSQALSRIAEVLSPDGSAVIPLFVPESVGSEDIGAPTRESTSMGWIQCQVVSAVRNEHARTQTLTLRYERNEGARTQILERDWVIHWISFEGFTAIARQAGLQLVSPPPKVDHEPVDVVLRH
ncbi:MAG TPA: class I SAM-dependent methyltransferase [Nocardioidaceae bacterium]|nr:class I SAM-dependent methyltransferase [Nocardioidaceae bacterium]